ncbi:CHAT domain-containing protein [Actinomadura sp. DC4]|uniref:CHAT domain-containing protein n=1 Tax=Actinomadura sp. DC4 TaxID=3055069 RepID=UPI0025AEFEFC|nr:CHAT domain-containing protein [Actinomadura sp. DC4]MDN3353862.1 CHAT domain-containing protein [Actinomadura sp. DC4]
MTERPEEPAAGDGEVPSSRREADRAVERLLDAADGGPAALADLAKALAGRFWLLLAEAAREDEEESAVTADLTAALEILAEAVASTSGKNRLQAAVLLGALSPAVDAPGAEDGTETLRTAIALFGRAAVRYGPDLPEAAALGVALGDRYEEHGLSADRDEAIVWLRRVYDVLVRPDAGLAPDHFLLALLLIDRAEQNHDVADATAAIGYAQRCLAGVAGDDPDIAIPLYRLGLAHLIRAQILGGDSRDDLEVAAEHLSAALGALPEGHEGHGQTAIYLGLARGMWARQESRTFPNVREAARERADEAVRLIGDGMAHLAGEDPLLATARLELAGVRAVRFLALAGDDDDRTAALAVFGEELDAPDCPVATADTCHVLSAALLLGDWTPRKVGSVDADFGIASVGRAMAVPPTALPREVADVALAHLGQVSEAATAGPEYGGLVQWLRACLTVAPDPGAVSEGSAAQAIADLEGSMAAAPDGDPGVYETQALIGLLHGLHAGGPEGEENRRRVAESFVAATQGLPDGHPLRGTLLGVLGGSAGIAFEGRDASRDELDAAVEALEHALAHMPDDHPARTLTLTRLGSAFLQNIRYVRSGPRLDRMRALLGEAVERSADPPNKAINLALLGLTEGFSAMFDADPDRRTSAIERLEAAAALAPENEAIQSMVHTGLVVLLGQRYMAGGGLESFDAAMYYAERIAGTYGEDSPAFAHASLTMEYFLALRPLVRYRTNTTPDQLEAASAALLRLRGRLPESHPMHGSLRGDLALLEVMRKTDGLDVDKIGREPELFTAYADTLAAELESTQDDDVFHSLGLMFTAFAKVNEGFARRDRRPMDEGIALLAEACEQADRSPAQLYQLLSSHGMALRLRYDVTRDRRDLLDATTRLEEARREAGQDRAGAELAGLLYTLALAYHERDDRQQGDRRAAAETGIAAMRETAGDVILQSDEARALDVAAGAAGDGADVARWCLSGGYAELAVEALELGRAMVLHAATADASVPALLRDGGHEGFAAEWERALAGGAIRPWDGHAGAMVGDPPKGLVVPSDLRHRVMRAIEGTEVERRLLAPPGVPEIAEALSAAGADALVYLLPRDERPHGLALIVGRDGRVRDVPLPGLATGDGSLVAAFARGADREVLPELCEWAWTAAMTGVLSAVPAEPPRRPRLVLVPVGELGAVPWHAARRVVAGGGRRYACQDATISYAASARQFVEARRLPARRWDSAPALVRVGGSGLFHASQEIAQIHRRHYPRGTLLGGRRRGDAPSPKATAERVRALLPRAGSPGASLLHLGCHALVAERPVESRLLLAQDEALAMTDILRQARERARDAAGGLVVLAACGSDETGRHHDEALTLATAFLAAGACGVVGARWPVADVPTALFMIMFHHYLNSGYGDPATALRAAQLWMLDPGRRPPAGLDPGLAEETACLDLTAIDAWAAFTYQGR